MSKSKDFMSLGEAYKDVFNKVIVSEDVPPGTTGEAPLIQGGPEEKGGFRPPLVDITKMSEKDKKDNIYNIKGYTYGDGNDPGDCNEPEPTGPTFGQVAYTGNVGPEEDEEDKVKNKKKADLNKDGELSEYEQARGKAIEDAMDDDKNEEDEEFLEEHEKIARDGLNNFMSKTSVFDKLYNKVMVNENFGEDAEDITDIEALGIETDVEVDEVPETIAVSIPGELAQTLCNILQTAIAQQETEVDIDVDVEEVTDTQFEEDEEAAMKDGGGYGVDAGSTLKHDVNYGHGGKNKVGKLKSAGAATDVDGGGYGVDAGSTLKHEVDMGKKNTVGNTKLGSIPGA